MVRRCSLTCGLNSPKKGTALTARQQAALRATTPRREKSEGRRVSRTPIEHEVTLDDGIVLKYYELPGAEDSRPVITSAGLGALDAAERFAALSPALRVYGFGFRGMGDSAGVGDAPVDVERVASDLHEVVLAVNEATGRRVSLIGNSMGANIIWRHADLFGEKEVERYVFMDQPVCVKRSFGGRDAIEGLLPKLRCAACLGPLVGCVQPKFRGVDFGALAELIADSESSDNSERLKRSCIGKPCLLYAGEASFIPDALGEAERISKLVGGPSRLLVFGGPHGTHSPHMPKRASDAGAVAAAAKFVEEVKAYLLTSEMTLRVEKKPHIKYAHLGPSRAA
tara:strand:- start:147 stop:1163 length:1017 start_codon:yes stop_codon:yes gene_type:complete